MFYCGVAYNIINVITKEAIRCLPLLFTVCAHIHNANEYLHCSVLGTIFGIARKKKTSLFLNTLSEVDKVLKMVETASLCCLISRIMMMLFGWRSYMTRNIKARTFVLQNWKIYTKVIKKCIRWCTLFLPFLPLETCLNNLSSNRTAHTHKMKPRPYICEYTNRWIRSLYRYN